MLNQLLILLMQMMIAMCIPNVIVLYILAPEIKRDLRDYLKDII